MGIFSRIASAIFGSPAKADEAASAAGGATAGSTTVAQAGGAAAGAAAAAPMTREQVEALIAKIAESSGHSNYNWKQSIVDLMKLLNLDSSLGARKELAQELGYKGALDGWAEMNVWLHKQVMEKLMASGGVVPDSLK